MLFLHLVLKVFLIQLISLNYLFLVLGEKDRFVPYRNNKLTMLMKDCLGGTVSLLTNLLI